MEMNTQNSSGMMNGLPPQRKSERKIGPIVGALIIVLILIIAALYFFGQKLNTNGDAMVPPPIVTETSTSTAATSTSTDDTSEIDAELDAQLEDVDYSF